MIILGYVLFHIHIKVSCTFPCDFVEFLLFLHSLLIHSFPSFNINHIGICWCDMRKRKEFLNRVCIRDLWITEQGSEKSTKWNSLSLAPQSDRLVIIRCILGDRLFLAYLFACWHWCSAAINGHSWATLRWSSGMTWVMWASPTYMAVKKQRSYLLQSNSAQNLQGQILCCWWISMIMKMHRYRRLY